MGTNTSINALNGVGQSVWYDNLSRDVLGSGELKRLIDNGVSGLTSNPTIFKKAIADSSDYDSDIRALQGKNLSVDDLCEELMVQDVTAAADLLTPTFERTKGADGYASIEVSPFLARDAAQTITAARRLWKKVNRPNAMIKIPGTEECLPAIRTALEEGINVNVTLLFSVSNYELVAEQYIAALEARAKRNEDIAQVRSVASFFVSRVDAISEKALAEKKSQQAKTFFGKVGVANARLAYESFEKLFRSPRFDALARRGALVQRPLWASTGTKSPDLNPLLYVEELAGKDTVNTMPPGTLTILLQGGKITNQLPGDVSGAKKLLKDLEANGISFAALMGTLQEEGVVSFADSYRALLDSVKKKQQVVAGSSAHA